MERRLLPVRRAAVPKGFDELAFYAEHFDTVEVNSTFYGQPRAEVTRGVGGAHAGAASSSRSSCIRSSPTRGCSRSGWRATLAARGRGANPRCSTRSQRPTAADVDAFRRGIDPLASSGKLGALLAQFPPSFKDTPAVARLSRGSCCGRSPTIRVAVELRHRSWSDRIGETLDAAERLRRRLGADRRAEVPFLDPPELAAERAAASTTCACTDGTPRSGGGTTRPRIATTTSIPPTN